MKNRNSDCFHHKKTYTAVTHYEPCHGKTFGVSDQLRLKPSYSATETSWSLEILDVASIGGEKQRC